MSHTILVIAPHPDDEILGCGGTILKRISTGDPVHILYLSSGHEQQALREQEAAAVCSFLGVKSFHFLRIVEQEFRLSLSNIERVLGIFAQISPQYVYINHDGDADFEHRISYEIVAESFWRYNNSRPKNQGIIGLLLYEIHKPMQTYNLIEDITDVIDEKMRAMSFYASQLRDARLDLAMKGLNQYRGALHEGVEFAEVFQIKKLRYLFPDVSNSLNEVAQ